MPPTSLKATSRGFRLAGLLGRGFTLVELTVVLVILSLVSLIVAPRLLAIQNSTTAQTATSRLANAMQTARSLARSRGETVAVGLDTESGVVNLSTLEATTTPVTNSNSTIQPLDPLDQDLRIGGSLLVSSVERTNAADPAPEVKRGQAITQFYSDGSALPATAEITVAKRQLTLKVRADGGVTLGEADANDETTAGPTRWPAGDLEQRTAG